MLQTKDMDLIDEKEVLNANRDAGNIARYIQASSIVMKKFVQLS